MDLHLLQQNIFQMDPTFHVKMPEVGIHKRCFHTFIKTVAFICSLGCCHFCFAYSTRVTACHIFRKLTFTDVKCATILSYSVPLCFTHAYSVLGCEEPLNFCRGRFVRQAPRLRKNVPDAPSPHGTSRTCCPGKGLEVPYEKAQLWEKVNSLSWPSRL